MPIGVSGAPNTSARSGAPHLAGAVVIRLAPRGADFWSDFEENEKVPEEDHSKDRSRPVALDPEMGSKKEGEGWCGSTGWYGDISI